ncbi:MAG: nucleotidyltransferase domain-containing protein [Armatimonadota bacterium]
MAAKAQSEKDQMDEIVDRIVKAIHPQKIVLFGSRARNQARPDSDIDILVIAESDEPRYKRSRVLYGAMHDMGTPIDIIVYTPEEVIDWSQVRQAFVTTALREGKILYESIH